MFKDRYDAANQLAESLKKYKNNTDVVIVAIPRGALQIGSVLAKNLMVPLDVVLTKKIGAPGQPELAIGAVSLQGQYIDPEFSIDAHYIEQEVKRIRKALQDRHKKYYKNRAAIDLKNKIVILTDDGVATGQTVLAAIELIKQQEPKKIIVALPVGPRDTIEKIKKKVDEVVCLLVPEFFYAIGQFYQHFPQVEDEEACLLFEKS